MASAKNLKITFICSVIFSLPLFHFRTDLQAQGPEGTEGISTGSGSTWSVPSSRKCSLPDNQESLTSSQATSETTAASGSMQAILEARLIKIKNVLENIEGLHDRVVKAFPQSKTYHEVELEDVPLKNDIKGIPISLKIIVALHYTPSGNIYCVVLESYRRQIYQGNQFTHKVIRLHYPNVNNIELEAKKYDRGRIKRFAALSPELKKEVLDLIFYNLQAALYKTDLLLALHNYYEIKAVRWQAEF